MNWLYVFLGGGLGALCRWAVAQWVGTASSGFPTATFIANMLGCLLIGVLSAFILSQDSKLQLFVLVGFLGGFTTFSSYGMELFKLQESAQWTLFLSYFFLSNVLGLIFVLVGNRLAHFAIST